MTKRCSMILIVSMVLLGIYGCTANGVKTGQAPVKSPKTQPKSPFDPTDGKNLVLLGWI